MYSFNDWSFAKSSWNIVGTGYQTEKNAHELKNFKNVHSNWERREERKPAAVPLPLGLNTFSWD